MEEGKADSLESTARKYVQSWKAMAGRGDGGNKYQFGDLSRSVLRGAAKAIFGAAAGKDKGE